MEKQYVFLNSKSSADAWIKLDAQWAFLISVSHKRMIKKF